MTKNLSTKLSKSQLNEIDIELIDVLETATAMMKNGTTNDSEKNYREMFSEKIKNILDKNQSIK